MRARLGRSHCVEAFRRTCSAFRQPTHASKGRVTGVTPCLRGASVRCVEFAEKPRGVTWKPSHWRTERAGRRAVLPMPRIVLLAKPGSIVRVESRDGDVWPAKVSHVSDRNIGLRGWQAM